MAENTEHPPSMRESIARGYEVGDVSIRAVLYVLAAFVAFGLIAHLVLWWLFRYEYRSWEGVDRPASVVSDTRPPATVPPLQPAPWHEKTPYQDMKSMREDNARRFDAMGWKLNKPLDQDGIPQVPDDIVAKVAGRKPSTVQPQPTTPPRNVVTPVPGVDQGGTR